ncbi:MAG: phosphoglucosamine mutase [Planctomycetaceae bacterium]|nr:phosphoglucosamine mutase [Planctomycetaceae bacterium]
MNVDEHPIISVSGLRGIVGSSLTPITVARYVAAYANRVRSTRPANLPGRPQIVVGRDGRESGPMLVDVVSATLMSCGVDVLVADLAATPTVGVLVRTLNADGAVQISASHNPPPYNGMKLFGPDGRVIPATAGLEVLSAYEKANFPWQSFDRLGHRHVVADTTTAHLQAVLATVDVARIQAGNFRVVLDSNHACGSLLGRRLLEALGCKFTIVGDRPDGQFSHRPEPTAENLAGVTKLAQEFAADAVFCQDPDADRLAIIDERGQYIGEEYTLALTLQHALASRKAAGHPLGPVVTNCSSSRMTMDIATRFGVPCFLSKVGEANVTDRMIAENAVYGGEGSGGPIDPRVGYVRDSFVGMAQVLDAMAQSHRPISALVSELPKYEIHKTTVQLPNHRELAEAIERLFGAVTSRFPEARASRLDGLRLDWDDAWLLIRPSNTEPIVRAVAESKSASRSAALCEAAAQAATSL